MRLSLLLLALHTSANAESRCPCLSSLAPYGIDTSSGLSVATTQGAHTYPATYGLSNCAAHDRSLAPFCDGVRPPTWCFNAWCYVNATECSAESKTSAYLGGHPRGGEVHFSYEACGASDAFSAWNAAFAGTLRLCTVAAEKTPGSGEPCGNTAAHLQVEAMVEVINNMTGGLGFQVLANNPSFPSYYKFSYEYYTYPEGQWEAVGRGLSERYFPVCDVIVGQGHGCSDDDIRAQAQVADASQRLYFTLRGPRYVLAADATLTRRLSSYLFSTHIRSDDYAQVALRKIALRAAGHTAGREVQIAVLNFAQNPFFEGVANEAARFAESPNSGYRLVYNASLADVCYNASLAAPYDKADDGACTPLATRLDAVVSRQPDVLVVSSKPEGFAEVLTRLSSERPAAPSHGSPGGSLALKALFWVGVPWLSGGEINCNGFKQHCAHAVGATQISPYEADSLEDALLRANGLPTTYAWLKSSNAALSDAYQTSLKAEPDAAIIPSIVAQAMAHIFRFSAPASRANPLNTTADYEALRSYLASGATVARTYYGDVAFDEFGNNRGREATSFQVDGNGSSRVIYPESLPEAAELVYPAPAYEEARLGAGAHALSYGAACDSRGCRSASSSEFTCDATEQPCGTAPFTESAPVGPPPGPPETRCLLCGPWWYIDEAPSGDQLDVALLLQIILPVGGVVILLIGAAVWYARRAARALEATKILKVSEAVEACAELSHVAALVKFGDFEAHGKLIQYEELRDARQLVYLDSLDELRELEKQGRRLVFVSHQWLSWSHPDPTLVQYRSIVAGVRQVAAKMQWPLAAVYVWVDYSSIPQVNAAMQQQAIDSLPAYVAASCAFLVCAPTAEHADEKGRRCDLHSYRQRMWCRVEQLAFMMSRSPDRMFVATGEGAADVQPVTHDDAQLLESLYVFEGDATDDNDKLKLVTPLLGLYARMLLAERADDSDVSRLFRSVLADGARRPLFPRKVRVQYELHGGKRTCAAHPKTKLLFGDLPRVTNRLVAEMKSGPRPAPTDARRKSSVVRAKQRLQMAAGRASASRDEAPAASSELETGERRCAKTPTPTPTPSSVSSHARVLVRGDTFTI